MMLQENYMFVRHHEEHREKSTQIILLLAGGALTVASWPSLEARSTIIVLASIVLILGLFGVLLSYKHTERANFHMERVRGFRKALAETGVDLGIDMIHKDAEKKARKKYRFLYCIRLHWLWAGISALIAAGGGSLLLHEIQSL